MVIEFIIRLVQHFLANGMIDQKDKGPDKFQVS
jgi:hypothetical protein